MFEAHFQLTRTPFARDCSREAVFGSQAHQELLRRLVYVAEQRRVMLLTGDSGSGKSTALRVLAGQLSPTAYQVIYLADVAFSPRSFFAALLAGLQQECPFQMTRAKALARSALLQCQRTQHRTPVLLLDEAQSLSPALLEEVRGLCNYDFDAYSPFALVLCGTRELARRLALQPFEALVQRIDLRLHLGGMSQEETSQYIRHHLTQAGARAEIFTPEAIQRIHQAAGGIPRRINKLATLALLAACSAGVHTIDDGLVDKVISHELQLPA